MKKLPRQKTKWINPKQLRPHPEIEKIEGRWEEDSDNFRALTESISAQGVLEPLVVTRDNQIMDGVTRWRAAIAANLALVPIICRPETEWQDILWTSELRRHSSKSSLAFRLYPSIHDDFDAISSGRSNNLKQLNSTDTALNAVSAQKRVEQWMMVLRISQRLLEQTRELYTLFDDYPDPWNWTAPDTEQKLLEGGLKPGVLYTFREWASAMIINEVMSTGYVLTALKQKIDQQAREKEGRPATGGVKAGEQLRLFNEGWNTVTKRWDYYCALDKPAQQQAVKAACTAFEKAPTEFLSSLVRSLTQELKRRQSEPSTEPIA